MFFWIVYLLTIILPIFFWWHYLRDKDRAEPEPRKLLLSAFIVGMGVALFSLAVEGTACNLIFGDRCSDILRAPEGQFFLSNTFLIILAGLVEEAVKFLAIWEFIYHRRDFNQIADGIIYATMLAMGFVLIENTMYLYDTYSSEGQLAFVMIGVMRAVLTALMHITSAGLIGYAFGRMKFSADHRRQPVYLALTFAVIFHAAYNFLTLVPYGLMINFILVFSVAGYLFGRFKRQESKLIWELAE